MTINDFKDQVVQIKQAIQDKDYESAHSLEDKLFKSLAEEITAPVSNFDCEFRLSTLQKMARVALTISRIDYPKHCS